MVDWRTGVHRASTKADVADATRLADNLSTIGFWWPLVGAGDCGDTSRLHELEAGWNNTVKHLQGFVQGGREARCAVEMATVVAGNGTKLLAPALSDLVFTVSPTLDRHGPEPPTRLYTVNSAGSSQQRTTSLGGRCTWP